MATPRGPDRTGAGRDCVCDRLDAVRRPDARGDPRPLGEWRSPEQGAVLLAVYALGLGVPFLVFRLAFTRTLSLVRALRRHWRVVNVASGMLLVGFGVLLATGELADLTSRLSRFAGVEL